MAKYLPVLAITFTFLAIFHCHADEIYDTRKEYKVFLKSSLVRDPSVGSSTDVALRFLARVLEGGGMASGSSTPAECLVAVFSSGFVARLTTAEAEKLAREAGVASVKPSHIGAQEDGALSGKVPEISPIKAGV